MEQPFIAQGRNNTLLNEQVNELLVHDGKRYTMVHGFHAKDLPMMDHGGSGWLTTDHADSGWITENHGGSRWNGMIGECKWILSDTDRHSFASVRGVGVQNIRKLQSIILALPSFLAFNLSPLPSLLIGPSIIPQSLLPSKSQTPQHTT